MKRALVAVAVAACGQTQPPRPPAPTTCDASQGMTCFEARRAACAPDTPGWRFELSASGERYGTFYISAAGLARFDFQDKQLYSTSAKEWLACFSRSIS